MRCLGSTRRLERGGAFSLSKVEELPGVLTLKAVGPGSASFFEGEAGGHRWQRIPPTEKRGRVQTSTVTVAILKGEAVSETVIRYQDVEFEAFRSGGPGGQNVNKVSSAVRARHIPTGITTECREERDQWKNKQRAIQKLQHMINQAQIDNATSQNNASRRDQIGSGMRGDKIRTYRTKDDVVTDHRSGNQTRLSKILKGDWDDLK